MNKKGFTLIELIVAIAIMGVLLIIALPQVAKIQSANKTKKYEMYKSSMERAAKLYTDSNSNDMFKNEPVGSYELKLDELKKANLMKDFQEEGVSCDSKQSVVCVTKVQGEYNYASKLVCTKNGKPIPQIPNNYPDALCNGEIKDREPPKIKIESKDFNTWMKSTTNKITITITITDSIGFLKNQSVEYRFVGKTYTTKWYTHAFKNEEILSNGNTPVQLSFDIKESDIPSNTDEYTIEVRGENADSSKKNKKGMGLINYVGKENLSIESKGLLKIDNQGPAAPTATIRYNSNTGTVRSNENTWTNKTLWWGDFHATDKGIGEIDHYEYSEKCTGEKSNNLMTSYTYTSNKDTYYCIRGVDKLNNLGEWSDPYYFKIDKNNPNVPTSVVMNLCRGGIYLNETGAGSSSRVELSKFNETGGIATCDLQWFDFNATDTGGAGIDHFEYSEGCTGNKSNDLGTTYHYKPGKDTYYCIRSVDKAGNPSPWSSKYVFKITKCEFGSGKPPTMTCPSTSATRKECSSSKGNWSSWGSCSKNCGTGIQKQTRVVTKTCEGQTTKLTETRTRSCSKDCFNIENASYTVCPSDQLRATPSQCAANQKDKMSVQVKKVSPTNVNVKVTVHMNIYSQSFHNDCNIRRVCLTKSSDECTHELGTFSISRGWLGLNKTKVVLDRNVDVSEYDKTNYRVVIDDKGCTNKIFRFRSDNTENAIYVKYNPKK